MDEALSGTDSKWWELSSISEVNNFLSRGAWKFVLKSTIGNRKLVGTKVVFKKKDEPDGTTRFKTRIVTLGYMQIPGVDYTEKFSPVANDTSVRIVFALVLYYYDSHGWRTKRLDVEAAFLEEDLVPRLLAVSTWVWFYVGVLGPCCRSLTINKGKHSKWSKKDLHPSNTLK